LAIDTLRGITEIGGFSVVDMDELRKKNPEKFTPSGGMDYKWFESEIRPNNFVYVRNDVNSIAFTIQNGPVKEVGVNGCQVDTIIGAAKIMLQGLYEKMPSAETFQAIRHLQFALDELEKRKLDREFRGVEGTSKA
jgi:hypothetical protein